MVDDKWIGLCLAVAGSFAIGTSFILTKKGLNDAGERNTSVAASDNYTYLRNSMWWAGMSTMILGEVANFAAYAFAPPILVTPLGALSVLVGAILASFLLNEELGHLGRMGCALCLIGSLIIVLHAPEDKDVSTVDEILHYALQPGFLLYCLTAIVFSMVMIYVIAPRYGRKNPMVYLSICSVAGSVGVMAIKGFGVAIKLTFAGHNQFSHPSTYVFGIVFLGCVIVQMNYFNKALDTFSTNVVNPMYFVGFSSCTILASLILFQGFNTTDAVNTISLLAGFTVTFLGVHLLNISRKPDRMDTHEGHDALEAGLMNPRMSLQGRMSMDGWNSATENGHADGRSHSRHGRTSSAYRQQSSTLFNAFEDGQRTDGVPLERLNESVSEEEDDSDVNERTHLRTDQGRKSAGSGSRSQSRSPTHPPRGDGRIALS